MPSPATDPSPKGGKLGRIRERQLVGSATMERDRIITVRPAEPVDTLQRLPAFVGISDETAGSTGIGMNVVVIPPGAAAEPHYHDGFETAIYLLSGRVETRYGDGLRQVSVNEAGDFLFIPAGVPHQPRNLSDTEPARALVARNTPNEQESVVAYPAP
jgi:uncharacterized RmlC-like cupin family protein